MSYSQRRYWTEEEDALLRRECETTRLSELSRKLKRSKKSIRTHAKLMGWPVPTDVCWMPEEDRMLRLWAGSLNAGQIGERLERSTDAVKARAVVLGLKIARPSDNDAWTLKEVCEKLGYDRKVVQRIGKELGQTWRVLVRRKDGDRRPLMYEISDQQFKAIVKYACSNEFKSLGELLSERFKGRKRLKDGTWLPKDEVQSIAQRSGDEDQGVGVQSRC